MKKLHSKNLGTLGELAVAKELKRRELPVFVELGDNSRVDIITIRNNKPYRIQVKTYSEAKGSIVVTANKSGPGYKFVYEPHDFELFAVYDYKRDKIYWVPLAMVLSGNIKSLSIRTGKPVAHANMASEFTSLNKAIKYLSKPHKVSYNSVPVKDWKNRKKQQHELVRRFVSEFDLHKMRKLRKQGKTNTEIGAELKLHNKTVSRYLSGTLQVKCAA